MCGACHALGDLSRVSEVSQWRDQLDCTSVTFLRHARSVSMVGPKPAADLADLRSCATAVLITLTAVAMSLKWRWSGARSVKSCGTANEATGVRALIAMLYRDCVGRA